MQKIKQPLRLLTLTAFTALLIIQAVPPQQASAAQITDRSLTLMAGTTDGGSKPGGVVNHRFNFTLPTSGTLGSIKFEYCTTAANSLANPTCVAPQGMTASAATFGSESGSGATGFSLAGQTANGFYVTRTAAATGGPNTAMILRIDGVTNPNVTTPTPQPNYTFFVRITSYASTDTTGTAIDSGTVAASTAEQIVLDGTMPESLVFCTGETISTTGGVPDCATATDGAITFNQLFSPTDTSTANSQMAASTNAGFGYAITVNGPTMTSGSNTITALNTSSTSIKGISQFGLNLAVNTTASSNPAIPTSGVALAPAANGTNYRGRAYPTAPNSYATADTFRFATGDIVADSNSDGTGSPDGTDAQIFTASYIVNVPGSQPAGTYTTTLTYICTPTF